MGPGQVEQNLGILRQFSRPFLKQADRPFEVTGLIGQAAERVRDRGIIRRQGPGVLGQFERLPGIVKPVGVELRQPDRGWNVLRILFQSPLVEVTRLLEGPVPLVDRSQSRQRDRVIGLFGKPFLQRRDRVRVRGFHIE